MVEPADALAVGVQGVERRRARRSPRRGGRARPRPRAGPRAPSAAPRRGARSRPGGTARRRGRRTAVPRQSASASASAAERSAGGSGAASRTRRSKRCASMAPGSMRRTYPGARVSIASRPSDPPEAVDGVLHDRFRGRRRLAVPEVVEQRVHRDDRSRVEREVGEQGALPRTTQREPLTRGANLKWSEQEDFHLTASRVSPAARPYHWPHRPYRGAISESLAPSPRLLPATREGGT